VGATVAVRIGVDKLTTFNEDECNKKAWIAVRQLETGLVSQPRLPKKTVNERQLSTLSTPLVPPSGIQTQHQGWVSVFIPSIALESITSYVVTGLFLPEGKCV
jgi:hypothetical protein